MAIKRFLLLALVWFGLWSATSFSAPAGYYLGWAEIVPIERGIQVSFNPIDCNVCSFAVILPQENGVLVAHFDVSLIASDQLPEAQEGKIVARKAKLIRGGKIQECPDPPCLVLGEKGEVVRFDVSSNRSLKPSELMLLTTDSVDRLSTSGLFEKVEVKTRRRIEADPIRVLEPFKPSAREDIVPDNALSLDAVKQSGNEARAPKEIQGTKFENASSVQIQDTGALDVPTLARVWPTNNNVGVSGFLHGLLFYGLGPTDLPSYPSGDLLLKTVTDEETAIRTLGRSPFIRTRNGLRYLLSNDPVFHTDVGESHRDQCLATFAALNLPLSTPIVLKSGKHSLGESLSEALANFDLHEREPAWTAMALAKYLPPKKEWVNRFRERTSFSKLAQHLLRVDLNSQSCAGTHIFQALAKIDSADRRYPILDAETRKELDSYLVETFRQVVQRQQEDGSWNRRWCDCITDDSGNMPPFETRLLVTGHLIEVLNSLDSQRRPPNAAYARAAEWLEQAIISKEIRPNDSLICPFTHAARGVREILTPSRTNRFRLSETSHPTE